MPPSAQKSLKGVTPLHTLTATLVIAFFCISTVILIVSSGSELYFNFQTQQKIVVTEERIVSQDTAAKVQEFVGDKFTALQTTAGVIDLSAATSDAQSAVIGKLLGRDPSFRSLFLLDTQGNELGVISRIAAPAIPTKEQASEMFSQIQTAGSYIGPVYFDDVTSEPLMYIAVPIKDVFGVTQGVAVADVNLKFMWDIVSTIQTNTGRTTYVVDKQGDLIAFIDTARILKGENLASLREVSEFMHGGIENQSIDNDATTGILGTKVITTHASLMTPDWGVVTELPLDIAYKPFIQELVQSLWVVLATLVFAVLAGIYFARRVTRPLRQLSDAVKEIAIGKLETKIKIRSKNEIGQLASAFNDMTEKLHQSYQDLDQKVKEKTAQLALQVAEGEKGKSAILNLLEDIDAEKNKAEDMVVERTRELREEKARLLASINSLSFGFILASVDDVILLRNPTLLKILDLKDEPRTMQEIAALFKTSDSKVDLDIMPATKRCMELKVPIEFKDVAYGSRFLRVICVPVSTGEAASGYILLVEDITEAKVMERSRDEFFAVASHELRTPLTAIRGNADMILEMYADKIVDKDMKEMLTDINSSSVRLIDIVNDFLEVSRLEQGKIEMKLEKFNPSEVVEKVIRDLKEMIAKKGLTLLYTPPSAPLPDVFADKNRTEQIIVNFVGNSTKFTKEGSISISLEPQGPMMRFRVTDTGAGISEGNQSLLFRKFQQAGEQMLARDVSQSTGLGLYICKLIVANMGGEIGLEKSELGKGSTFFFTVPIAS